MQDQPEAAVLVEPLQVPADADRQVLFIDEMINVEACEYFLELAASRACMHSDSGHMSYAELVAWVLKRVYKTERRNGVTIGWIKSAWWDNPKCRQLNLRGRLVPAVGEKVNLDGVPAEVQRVLIKNKVPMGLALMPLAIMTREVQNVMRIRLDLVDIDVVNCEFNVEAKFMMTETIHWPAKMRYLRDRAEILKTLSEHYHCAPGLIKKLFIALGNGGRVKTWRQAHNISELVKDPEFVLKFAMECDEFIDVKARQHADRLNVVTGWGVDKPKQTLHYYNWTHFERVEMTKVMQAAGNFMLGYAFDGILCKPGVDVAKLQAATTLPLMHKKHPQTWKKAIAELAERFPQFDWDMKSQIPWSELWEAKTCIWDDANAPEAAAGKGRGKGKVAPTAPQNHRDFAYVVASILENKVHVGAADEKVVVHAFLDTTKTWRRVGAKFLHNMVANVLLTEFCSRRWCPESRTFVRCRGKNYLKSGKFINTILGESCAILVQPDAPDFDGEATRKYVMWQDGTCFDTELMRNVPTSMGLYIAKFMPWGFKEWTLQGWEALVGDIMDHFKSGRCVGWLCFCLSPL